MTIAAKMSAHEEKKIILIRRFPDKKAFRASLKMVNKNSLLSILFHLCSTNFYTVCINQQTQTVAFCIKRFSIVLMLQLLLN
jgi:hypothetical protein